MSICIFLLSGKTFTFHGVSEFRDNETGLVFSYTAMSDGNQKCGHFLHAQIAGYSRWKPS